MNAGILFYDGNKVLSGKTRRGKWNGIGGKAELGETAMYTAIRESMEEIFGVDDVDFIRKVSKTLFPKVLYRRHIYVLFKAPIQELLNISALMQKENIPSSTYESKMPNTVEELIENFTSSGELLKLRLIDANDIPEETVDYFRKDIDLFKFLRE